MHPRDGIVTVDQMIRYSVPGEFEIDRSFAINEPVFDVQITAFMAFVASPVKALAKSGLPGIFTAGNIEDPRYRQGT